MLTGSSLEGFYTTTTIKSLEELYTIIKSLEELYTNSKSLEDFYTVSKSLHHYTSNLSQS